MVYSNRHLRTSRVQNRFAKGLAWLSPYPPQGHGEWPGAPKRRIFHTWRGKGPQAVSANYCKVLLPCLEFRMQKQRMPAPTLCPNTPSLNCPWGTNA